MNLRNLFWLSCFLSVVPLAKADTAAGNIEATSDKSQTTAVAAPMPRLAPVDESDSDESNFVHVVIEV